MNFYISRYIGKSTDVIMLIDLKQLWEDINAFNYQDGLVIPLTYCTDDETHNLCYFAAYGLTTMQFKLPILEQNCDR